MATLLVAPAAHGKTQYAIQRITSLLANEPLAPVTVILPNQARLAELRRRLAMAGIGSAPSFAAAPSMPRRASRFSKA